MNADDLGFDPDLGYRTSLYEEHGHQYIVIETTIRGESTGAAVVIPASGAPFVAHAILDQWVESAQGDEED